MKSKKILVLISLLVIISVVVLIVKLPIVQGKLNLSDAIKLKIKLSYNDSDIEVDAGNFMCTYEDGKACNVNYNEGVFSVKGGEYGCYRFYVTVPKGRLNGYDNDLVICLNFMNLNDWYISDSDCRIALTEGNNNLYGKVKINTAYNDGTATVYDEELEVTNNVLEVHWGM